MQLVQLCEVEDYISSLSDKDSARILAHLKSLENGWTGGLMIKPLKGRIMELTVGQYRVVYFQHKDIIYVMNAFRKKSRKAPRNIIRRAEQTYLLVMETKKT